MHLSARSKTSVGSNEKMCHVCTDLIEFLHPTPEAPLHYMLYIIMINVTFCFHKIK